MSNFEPSTGQFSLGDEVEVCLLFQQEYKKGIVASLTPFEVYIDGFDQPTGEIADARKVSMSDFFLETIMGMKSV